MAIVGFGGYAKPGEEEAGFALFLTNLIGGLNRDPEGKPLNYEARLIIFYEGTRASESNVQNSPVFAACSPEIEMDAWPAWSRRFTSSFSLGFANNSLIVITLSSTPVHRISA
jgi:hypothetical protein